MIPNCAENVVRAAYSPSAVRLAAPRLVFGVCGHFRAIHSNGRSCYISTHLFAGGWDYPVQGETKQRWIELCSEAAICDDPQRMDELSQAITALLDQEKQRLHAVPRTAP